MLLRRAAAQLPRFTPRCTQLRSFRAVSYTFRSTPVRTFPARSQWQRLPSLRSIATSAIRFQESESQVNEELAAKLTSELSMEKEMRDPANFPAHLKEYLDNSPYELEDAPGKEEITLTRKFGDETIRVMFSIDDLHNQDEDPDQQLDDPAMMDEPDDPHNPLPEPPSGGPNAKGTINQGATGGNIRVAPEDSVAPADTPELEEDDADVEDEQQPAFPAHMTITVERKHKGSLRILATAQDGMIMIDAVHFFKNSKHADPQKADDHFGSRDIYTGPPFASLDEDLQMLFERFLDERGINTTMALFIPEYIDYKENREYLDWLSAIKYFVE